MWRDVTPQPSLYSNRFYHTALARLAKRFPWHVLSKQRSCSPYSGIPINTDVGNPTVPVAMPPPSMVSSKQSRGRLLVFSLFIMRPRLVSFIQSSIESTPRPEFQHPEPQIRALRTFNNVRLRPSGPVVTEEDVLKLREARYLTCEISHRLPAKGQVIPTPEPGESVMFMSHLRRGLGFPMDPLCSQGPTFTS